MKLSVLSGLYLKHVYVIIIIFPHVKYFVLGRISSQNVYFFNSFLFCTTRGKARYQIQTDTRVTILEVSPSPLCVCV